MCWRGLTTGTRTHKKKLTLRKRHLFVILVEKSIEDAEERQKIDPDLVESIMKPSGLVKEELRLILFKMGQSESQVTKIKVSTFWIPESRRIPAGGQCQPAR